MLLIPEMISGPALARFRKGLLKLLPMRFSGRHPASKALAYRPALAYCWIIERRRHRLCSVAGEILSVFDCIGNGRRVRRRTLCLSGRFGSLLTQGLASARSSAGASSSIDDLPGQAFSRRCHPSSTLPCSSVKASAEGLMTEAASSLRSLSAVGHVGY
jgi:hypothetical protein